MTGDCLGSVDGGQVEGEYSEWGCVTAVTGINMRVFCRLALYKLAGVS